jgi:hypothetical protein
MGFERNREYLVRREADERKAATAAASSAARAIHLELAYLYAGVIAQLDNVEEIARVGSAESLN